MEETLRLDADLVAPATRGTKPMGLSLSWRGIAVDLVVEKVGDSLEVRGGPRDPDRVPLERVVFARGRVRHLFRCAGCGARRKLLYLPRGSFDWRCRSCHGLKLRRRRRDSLETVQSRWEAVGEQIARLRLVQAFGESPLIKTLVDRPDDPSSVAQIRREVAKMKKVLRRMAPAR